MDIYERFPVTIVLLYRVSDSIAIIYRKLLSHPAPERHFQQDVCLFVMALQPVITLDWIINMCLLIN